MFAIPRGISYRFIHSREIPCFRWYFCCFFNMFFLNVFFHLFVVFLLVYLGVLLMKIFRTLSSSHLCPQVIFSVSIFPFKNGKQKQSILLTFMKGRRISFVKDLSIECIKATLNENRKPRREKIQCEGVSVGVFRQSS